MKATKLDCVGSTGHRRPSTEPNVGARQRCGKRTSGAEAMVHAGVGPSKAAGASIREPPASRPVPAGNPADLPRLEDDEPPSASTGNFCGHARRRSALLKKLAFPLVPKGRARERACPRASNLPRSGGPRFEDVPSRTAPDDNRVCPSRRFPRRGAAAAPSCAPFGVPSPVLELLPLSVEP